ncbi:MAG: protein kinase [Pirellulales bacterium]
MVPDLQWHPSQHELAAFLSGRETDVARCVTVEEHLTACPECQVLAENLAETLESDNFERQLAALHRPHGAVLSRLTGGYELLGEIGRGGSGIVYRARQVGMAREVAVKVLAAGGDASATELARFRREIAALARLNHAHIVQVFDTGELDGTPFLAMELIHGPTLAEWLRQQLPEPGEAAMIVRSLADAVETAHQQGIIHRDLKPQNVLLDRAVGPTDSTIKSDDSSDPVPARLPGVPKIADFGISQMDDQHYRTQTGQVLGTPAYMAPEMAQGQRDALGPAIDVYGLGAILYECLTGRPPFAGSSTAEILRAVIETDVVSIKSLRGDVPRDLATICERCLRKHPAHRFATAAELRDELGRYLRGEPIQSRPVSTIERSARWMIRNPWPVAVGSLIVLGILAGISGLLVHQRRLTTERDAARASYDATRKAIRTMLDTTHRESKFDIPQLRQMSLSQFRTAHDLFERLSKQERTPAAARELARIRIQYGSALVASNEFDAGQRQFEAAQEYLRTQVGQFPEDETLVSDLISSQVKLAITRNSKGDPQAAVDILNRTLPLAVKLHEQFPKQLSAIDGLSWVYDNLGSVLTSMGDHARAAEEYGRAVALLRRARELNPDNEELPTSLAETQVSQAMCWMVTDRTDEAEAGFRDAIATLNRALQRRPKDPRTIAAMAVAYLNLSNISAFKQDLPGAISDCSRGIELLEMARSVDPEHPSTNDQLCMLYANRAMFKGQQDPPEEGVSDWRLAISRSIDDSKTHLCRTNLIRSLATAHEWQQALDEIRTSLEHVSSSQQRFEIAVAAVHVADAMSAADSIDSTAEQSPSPVLEECLQQVSGQLQQLAKDGYFTTAAAAKDSVLTSDEFKLLRDRFGADTVAAWLQ